MSMPPIPRPASVGPEVIELCKRLAPGASLYSVQAIKPPPWAEPDECTENVARVVKEHGGRTELGWQLWETLPGVMIEAEFHAVWIDSEGDRLDVTPKTIPGLKHITFLPDESLVYEGRQIDNVRVPLVDDQLVYDFVDANERVFEAMNRGELADRRGVPLTSELKILMRQAAGLEQRIIEKYYADSHLRKSSSPANGTV